MLNDFSKLLSSLRKEKKISQRKAAQALEISQALLSHYENGAREPGIAFIVRAADYYNVSTDYLLGRTEIKNMNAIHTETAGISLESEAALRGGAYAQFQKKIIADSVILIMDELSKVNNKSITTAVSEYLSTAIYKLCRYIYLASENNSDDVFPVGAAFFPDFCDAEMKQCEIKLKKLIYGIRGGAEESNRTVKIPELSCEKLNKQYPQFYPSFVKLLTEVSEKIQKKINA